MSLRGFRQKFTNDRKLHIGPNTPQDHVTIVPGNATFFQGFEWYLASDSMHYRRLKSQLERLKQLGVDQIWLPPGCKAGWQGSNGYDVYDAYDLGEFDQKDSRRTKFGDKQDLIDLSKFAHAIGVKLCWDAVLNHRSNADYTEKCLAVKVNPQGTCSNLGSLQINTNLGIQNISTNSEFS